MINIVISTILITLLLSPFAAAETLSGVAAIVNDEIITLRELNRAYSEALKEAATKGDVAPETAAKIKRDALGAMIDKKLIRQRVVELRIVVSDDEVRLSIEDVKKQNKMSQEELVAALLTQGMTLDQYKAQMKEQLERLRLMSQEVNSKVQVSEKEIKDYYENNQRNYTDEEAYRARAIFLRLAEKATFQDIRAVVTKIETATAAAKKGRDFTELAKTYSDDDNAQKDSGDLGFFKKSEMLPELEKIVLSMKIGEVEVIAIPGGFYILKLEEKKPGYVKPFDDVKGQIEDTLFRSKSEQRFTRWLEELRKTATIEVKL